MNTKIGTINTKIRTMDTVFVSTDFVNLLKINALLKNGFQKGIFGSKAQTYLDPGPINYYNNFDSISYNKALTSTKTK
jgi:hypothetical protein